MVRAAIAGRSVSPQFTPPATSSVPAVLPVGDPEQTAAQYALMRFFRARPEGVNVYMYREGSTFATYLESKTPPLSRVTEDDPVALYDSDGVVTTNGWDDLEIVFWGGTGPYTVRIEAYDLLVMKDGKAPRARADAVQIGAVRFVVIS